MPRTQHAAWLAGSAEVRRRMNYRDKAWRMIAKKPAPDPIRKKIMLEL